MKVLAIIIVAMGLTGCVSASTQNKVCADLSLVSGVVGAVNANAGKTIAEYTPKKCVSAGVNGDAGKLTGGVNAGVSNE